MAQVSEQPAKKEEKEIDSLGIAQSHDITEMPNCNYLHELM